MRPDHVRQRSPQPGERSAMLMSMFPVNAAGRTVSEASPEAGSGGSARAGQAGFFLSGPQKRLKQRLKNVK